MTHKEVTRKFFPAPRRRAPIALVAASAVVLLAACTGGDPTAQPTAEPQQGGTINWMMSAPDPGTLDPKTGFQSNQHPGLAKFMVFGELVHRDPTTGEITPGLAESVEPNDDNTVWTITLREGLTFSDGEVFDAEAVKFNWERLADPEEKSPAASTVLSFDSIEVEDELTLVVTLPEARGGFPVYLGGLVPNGNAQAALALIGSPAAIERCGEDFGKTVDCTIGAGPFVLTDWVQGSAMTFERSASYYDAPRPYLDGITLQYAGAPDVTANAALAGQVDLATFFSPTSLTTPLVDNPDWVLWSNQGATSNFGVAFNPNRAPFDDVRVRQALLMALDMDDVINKALAGAGVEATTWFPEGSRFDSPPIPIEHNQFDEAQALIDEYVAENGPVVGSITASPNTITVNEVLVQQWNELEGVTITLDQVDGNTEGARIGSGDYVINTRSAPTITSLEDIYGLLHSGLSTNNVGYENAEVDELLEEYRGLSLDELDGPVQEIIQLVVDDVLYLPTFQAAQWTFAKPNLGGEQYWSAVWVRPDLLFKTDLPEE
jgi:peptide/nickel transport system substrate-binding protein